MKTTTSSFEIPPPSFCGPVPSVRQSAWHQMEFYGFIHFTVNTFTNREWGLGDESPSCFHPSDLDAGQWARTAKAAGMTGLILTCKHHDGFCLWPSRFTEHSVKNSPWKNGRGDVVRALSEACGEQGLKFGVYLSPWDRHHAEYGKAGYISYYRNQMKELLTEYGPIFEVWLDGANGGDGYYGGAREMRKIDLATYYEWPTLWSMIREYQPNAVIFSDAGPDIRWVGNETGTGSEINWYRFNAEGRYPGYPEIGDLGTGHENGTVWLPPEVDVSIRPGWFWHARENAYVKTAATLLDIYMRSVGRGAALLLNLPPDARGRIHEIDVERLMGLRQALDRMFESDLAPQSRIEASNTRGNSTVFAARNVADGNSNSYWAADDGILSADLEFSFERPVSFNTIKIQETIALGQRVRRWRLEARIGTGWQSLCEGKTLGYKRLARFDTVRTDRVRLRIIDALTCPAIASVAFHAAPTFASDPKMLREGNGRLHLSAGKGVKVRYTTDGRRPTTDSALFEDGVVLPNGGMVTAAVLAQDNPDTLVLGSEPFVQRHFGLIKDKWRVIDATGRASSDECDRPEWAIDDDSETKWIVVQQPFPHELVVDLGEEIEIAGFGYIPRTDGRADGNIEQYAFYVGYTPAEWGRPVVEGAFDNMVNAPVEQAVEWKLPVRGRFVKLVSKRAVGHVPCTAVAELNVFTKPA